ncbi:hypothetical protein K7395_00105 [Streptomyces filamentosus]|uniref:Uncharacterized protein n=1 Tax=Streptomyces filamentosus TaxID=67294 RepID=A0ABY4UME9_STRFL|nr:MULTISPECIES: hypothetical protein [Streptomyces]MYR83348.1 hypothetical protein [Streptomyces sp. SID5466]USC45235.1 hypothetical protein K7395_00105 [Streptomyces filamentosus]
MTDPCCSGGGFAEPDDLLMLGCQLGEGRAAEIREVLDFLLRPVESFLEFVVFCLEPGDLGLARVGDLAGILHRLESSFELDAEVSVGAGAVERGAVDGGLAGEGLDVTFSAGRDLAA